MLRSTKASSEDAEDGSFSSSVENEDDLAAKKINQEVDEPLALFTQHKPMTSRSPITSPTTTTSTSSPPSHRRSPVNTTSGSEDGGTFGQLTTIAPVTMYPRSSFSSVPYSHFPFAFSTSSSGSNNPGSEKFRKLKLRKEKRENRKEKNVLKTFKVERDSNDDDYDVDNVLESLGELDKPGRKLKAGGGDKASNGRSAVVNGNQNGKYRRNSSGDNSNDEDEEFDDDKKSDDSSSSSPDSSTVSSAELIERSASRNAVDFSEEADLKLHSSRSAENLHNFTKVTKKQKRKKQQPPAGEQQRQQSSPPPPPQQQPQQRDAYQKSNGVSSSKTRPPPTTTTTTINGSLERSSTTTTTTNSSHGKVIKSKSTEVNVDQQQNATAVKMLTKTDLDLAADFPPLLDAPLSSNAAPVWPIVRPSANPSDKSSAVMKPSSACELNCINDDPPKTTVQAMMPEAANESNTEPCSLPPRDDPRAGPNKAEGIFIEDGKGEANQQPNDCSTTPKATGIVDNGNGTTTSYEDDDEGFTFGFDVNEELLSMTFVNTDAQQLARSLEQQQQQQQFEQRQFFEQQQRHYEHQQRQFEHSQQMEQMRHHFEQQRQFQQQQHHQQQQLFEHFEQQQQLELVRQQFEQRQQQFGHRQQELESQEHQLPPPPTSASPDVTAGTTLTLNQEDSAIVCFGESIDDSKLTASPESGIYVCPGTQPDSERSTPQPMIDDSGSSSWTCQVDDDVDVAGTVPSNPNNKFNLAEVAQFVRCEWKKIEAEMQKGSKKVRYYRKPSVL